MNTILYYFEALVQFYQRVGRLMRVKQDDMYKWYRDTSAKLLRKQSYDNMMKYCKQHLSTRNLRKSRCKSNYRRLESEDCFYPTQTLILQVILIQPTRISICFLNIWSSGQHRNRLIPMALIMFGVCGVNRVISFYTSHVNLVSGPGMPGFLDYAHQLES